MPMQKVEIEVDVPEGWELTGKSESYTPLSPEAFLEGQAVIAARFYLGEKPNQVEEWVAAHPWLPEGVWIWKHNSRLWYSSRSRPMKEDNLYYNPSGTNYVLDAIALYLGHTFTPPPVDCLQVVRPEAKEQP